MGRNELPIEEKKMQLSMYVSSKEVNMVGGKKEAEKIGAEAVIRKAKSINKKKGKQ